jgi:arylsulfatase
VVSQALVEEVDLAPSLLAAAGLEVPGYMQGVSLAPILGGDADPGVHKARVICHFNRSDDYLAGAVTERTHATMSFDGHHKLVVYHGHDLCELFDLEADPGEFDNLWDGAGAARRETLLRQHIEAIAATLSRGAEPYTGSAVDG